MNNQRTTSPQDTFRPIPGLISCTEVTGRWGLLYHALNAVRWLALLYACNFSDTKATLIIKRVELYTATIL